MRSLIALILLFAALCTVGFRVFQLDSAERMPGMSHEDSRGSQSMDCIAHCFSETRANTPTLGALPVVGFILAYFFVALPYFALAVVPVHPQRLDYFAKIRLKRSLATVMIKS